MRISPIFTPVALSLAISASPGCASDNTSATLQIDNQSDFAIVEMHVAPVGSTTWGANLLSTTLEPGDSLVLGTTCDSFDVLLVDEAGVDCEVDNVDLCLNDAQFIVRNNTCTVFGGFAPTTK